MDRVTDYELSRAGRSTGGASRTTRDRERKHTARIDRRRRALNPPKTDSRNLRSEHRLHCFVTLRSAGRAINLRRDPSEIAQITGMHRTPGSYPVIGGQGFQPRPAACLDKSRCQIARQLRKRALAQAWRTDRPRSVRAGRASRRG